MTPQPTVDPAPTLLPPSAGLPIPSSASPYGIAPVAAGVPAPRRRSRRRRLVDAAVVSSTLATLPVAAAWNRVDAEAGGTTLVEAVEEFEAAEDGTEVLATASWLRSSVGPAVVQPATAPAPAPAPAPARPAMVAAAPAPADTGPASLGATPADAEEEPTSPLVAAAEAATATEATPIARAGGLEIVAPSTDTVLVGFHEAAGPGTETLESLAPLAVDLNAKDTAVASDASPHQVAPVMELPTRDRGQAAASAVDIAVPAWSDIVAPVSGKVVAADPYVLYGEFPDNRVEIEPAGHPGLRVVMIHIGEVQVRPGDQVVAGETLVARTAKQFPFTSQIDRFSAEVSGTARPHVHMEVRRVG